MMKKEQVPSKTKKGFVSVPERMKALDETECFAVLATDEGGRPYTSLINFAFTVDLKKVIFATPRETRKYKNILKTHHISLLIDNRSKTRKNLMETEAVTVIGTAHPIRKGKVREELAAIFLKKHPDLESFIQSPSTVLIVLEANRCIHVSKFQTISVWECK